MRVVLLMVALGAFAGVAILPASGQNAPASIKVRLLAAENRASDAGAAEIQDVLPLLQKTLKFASYRLLATQRVAGREGARVDLDQGISLTITAIAGDSLTVEVNGKERRLLQTKLRLAPDKPVILGGLPGRDGGTLIVVLSL